MCKLASAKQAQGKLEAAHELYREAVLLGSKDAETMALLLKPFVEYSLQNRASSPTEGISAMEANEKDVATAAGKSVDVSGWEGDWSSLLPELHDMGFVDENTNRAAVVQNKGDLKHTVAQLVAGERARRALAIQNKAQ